jgi:dihydropteroate synthase
VIAKSSCDVCLMHMQGKPQTMQKKSSIQWCGEWG